MRDNKDNSVYLKHIQDSVIQIRRYLSNHTIDQFLENEWDQAVVMPNLEVIGEAANNVESEFQKRYTDIPWKTIIGLRNVLIHDYMEVDMNIVWQIITKDLEPLYQQISKIVDMAEAI